MKRLISILGIYSELYSNPYQWERTAFSVTVWLVWRQLSLSDWLYRMYWDLHYLQCGYLRYTETSLRYYHLYEPRFCTLTNATSVYLRIIKGMFQEVCDAKYMYLVAKPIARKQLPMHVIYIEPDQVGGDTSNMRW